MSLVAKGNVQPRIAEGTTIVLSVDGDSGTVIKKGTYASLLAGRPAKSSEYEHEGVTFLVTSTTLRREKGGLGTLTINLFDRYKSGSGNPNILENPNETVELDYTLIEKAIENHPLFKELMQMGAARSAYRKWYGLPDSDPNKELLRYPIVSNPNPENDGDYDHLPTEPPAIRQLADLKLGGIEAYFLQVPVVRKTTVLATAPNSSSAGQRDNPPEFSSVSAVWLKTADKVSRSGKRGAWQRTEEWTGFDDLNDLIYPPS